MTYGAVYDQFQVMMMILVLVLMMAMMMMTMMMNMNMMMMMQVGPGDDYVLTIGGFNDALSTLGDAMTSSNSALNLNGMKFTTK